MKTQTPGAGTLLLIALIPVLLLGLGALGSRFGVWHFGIGLKSMPVTAGLAVILAITLVVWWRRALRNAGSASSLVYAIAIAICLAPGIYVGAQILKAKSLPLIHDISTDLDDPPVFQSASITGAARENSLEFDAKTTVAAQRSAYPDIVPVTDSRNCDEVFALAYNRADALGWEIAEANPDAGYVEATATTRWYGFKDDIVIRLRSKSEGCRVDVRSISRVGLSDVGANAERIRLLLSGL